jgi:hypothetical protein
MGIARESGRRRAGMQVLAIVALGVAGLAGGAGAQVEPGTLAPGEVSEPKAQALLVTCPPKPPADPCEILTCKSGEWVSTFKAVGVACNDGDSCTYNDKCVDTAGTCTGTRLVCVARGPCETSTCNGTSSCSVAPKPAGTACGYQSGDPSEPTNPCGNACDGASYLCQP